MLFYALLALRTRGQHIASHGELIGEWEPAGISAVRGEAYAKNQEITFVDFETGVGADLKIYASDMVPVSGVPSETLVLQQYAQSYAFKPIKLPGLISKPDLAPISAKQLEGLQHEIGIKFVIWSDKETKMYGYLELVPDWASHVFESSEEEEKQKGTCGHWHGHCVRKKHWLTPCINTPRTISRKLVGTHLSGKKVKKDMSAVPNGQLLDDESSLDHECNEDICCEPIGYLVDLKSWVAYGSKHLPTKPKWDNDEEFWLHQAPMIYPKSELMRNGVGGYGLMNYDNRNIPGSEGRYRLKWVFNAAGNLKIWNILKDPTLYRDSFFLIKLKGDLPMTPYVDPDKRAAFDKTKWPAVLEVDPPKGFSKQWIELLPDKAGSMVSPVVLGLSVAIIVALAVCIGCACLVRRKRTKRRRESLNSLREKTRASLSNTDAQNMSQFKKDAGQPGKQ